MTRALFQWNLAVNIGLQLRSALSSMVFRKALRLRRLTGNGGNTAGQVVNIISTDPERVIMACNVRPFTSHFVQIPKHKLRSTPPLPIS